MEFRSLLSRADEHTLQTLIGRRAVRLLAKLDPSTVRPSNLQHLLLKLRPPIELLRDADARSQLLDLLPHQVAQTVARLIGGHDLENPYIYLRQRSFRANSHEEAVLFRTLNIPLADNESFSPPPDTTEQIIPSYQLFPHQRCVASRISTFMASDTRRVLVHMPTGSGKTRTLMRVICDHLNATAPTLVIWLAYSEELCEQALTEFSTAWSFLGNRPLNAARFWGPHNLDVATLDDGFLVAGLSKTYNAAVSHIPWIKRLASKTTLIIIDEAHQAIAPTYSTVLNALESTNRDTTLIGLTATPGRSSLANEEDERLADFFFRQKVTLEIPASANPINSLVDQGYLARPTFEKLDHDGHLSLTHAERHRITSELDIPPAILHRLAGDEQRNLKLLVRLQDLTHRHSRIICFAATVDHARLLATVLQARGTEAYAITGTTPADERKRILTVFNSESTNPIILCNYGVLTTGFDAPKTSCAVIARPTKSVVLFSQMVGRAIRGPRAGGNTSATIVTVIDSDLPAFHDVAAAFHNWEDIWS